MAGILPASPTPPSQHHHSTHLADLTPQVLPAHFLLLLKGSPVPFLLFDARRRVLLLHLPRTSLASAPSPARPQPATAATTSGVPLHLQPLVAAPPLLLTTLTLTLSLPAPFLFSVRSRDFSIIFSCIISAPDSPISSRTLFSDFSALVTLGGWSPRAQKNYFNCKINIISISVLLLLYLDLHYYFKTHLPISELLLPISDLAFLIGKHLPYLDVLLPKAELPLPYLECPLSEFPYLDLPFSEPPPLDPPSPVSSCLDRSQLVFYFSGTLYLLGYSTVFFVGDVKSAWRRKTLFFSGAAQVIIGPYHFFYLEYPACSLPRLEGRTGGFLVAFCYRIKHIWTGIKESILTWEAVLLKSRRKERLILLLIPYSFLGIF